MTSGQVSTLNRLRGLLEVARLVRSADDLGELLEEVASAASETLGFAVVAVNLYRPAWDDFEIVVVHGSEEGDRALVGQTAGWEFWHPLLNERLERHGAYFVPDGAIDWDAFAAPVVVPELEPIDDPNAWLPGDALFVPLRGADGRMLGVVSVDSPASGLRPDEDEIRVLAAFADHAAVAVEAAQEAARSARHRLALERLLETSLHLAHAADADTILRAVCEGVRDALGFESVSVDLVEGDVLRAHAVVGWRAGDPELEPMPLEEVDRLLDPEFEQEGCFLVPSEIGEERSAHERVYVSRRNGRGPHAWHGHCLLVPLREPDGTLRGVVWVDDPVDRLLPGRETLQALRAFANLAATALAAAARLAELRESRELYRMVFQHAADLIALADLDGRLLLVSDSYEAVLGYAPAELVGKAMTELFEDGDAERVAAAVAALASGEAASSAGGPGTMRHRDGRAVLVEGVCARIDDDHGRPRYLLATAHDVTDRERLERELHRAQRLEAVGRLAGGVAHDFNNVLTAIVGYTDFARSLASGTDLGVASSLDEIRKVADRAAGLTRQLLAFSRKQLLQPRVLDLNEVIRDAESLLRTLVGEDVEVVTSMEEGLGRIEIDPSRLEQVIVNLAVNARDAMPTGGRLSIATRNALLDEASAAGADPVAPGAYVVLEVADTGEGMDDETRGAIFEPFYTTKPVGQGSGLGLATVYGIVRQSGGRIEVESEAGAGSTFTIWLPRTDAEPPAERPERERGGGGGGGPETILLVEDEDVVRRLVSKTLERSGFTVLDASRGEEALALAQRHPGQIDLLLTDVVMPGMSGPAVAERLALLWPGTKVLFMSGYTGGRLEHHGIVEADAAFIEKPFTLSALVRRVREILDTG
jgi:PAS domain S-box-containing protein